MKFRIACSRIDYSTGLSDVMSTAEVEFAFGQNVAIVDGDDGTRLQLLHWKSWQENANLWLSLVTTTSPPSASANPTAEFRPIAVAN